MGLENIVRRSVQFTLASAGAILLVLSYRAFFRGESVSGTTYALSSLIPIALAANSYRSSPRRKNSEETGSFGVPDQVIRAIEKRDSGRYHQL